jgi:hypothetical protein
MLAAMQAGRAAVQSFAGFAFGYRPLTALRSVLQEIHQDASKKTRI